MGFIDFFRPSYKLVASQGCAGCAARIAHIEDLQNLIRSEREGNAILQSILIQKSGFTPPPVESEAGELKPLRAIQSMGSLRRQAEAREKTQFPNARHDYWQRVQADYDRAGKLPNKEEEAIPPKELKDNA